MKVLKLYNNDRGNALFLILIAVALFAALSYAVTNSGRGGSGIDKEKQTLAISELLQYASSFQTAALRMRLINHCDEDHYTFEDNNGTMIQADGTPYDFTNSNAPSDGSCHFFDANGGGIAPKEIPEILTIAPSTVTPTTFSHPQTTILANYEFLGHGTDGGTAATSDLVLRMGRLTRGACIEINNALGVNNPSGEPPLDRATGALFTGTYAAVSDVMGDVVTDLVGKDIFCNENALATGGGQSYHLMVLIHAR